MSRAINVKGEISYLDFLKFSKQLYSSRTMNLVCACECACARDERPHDLGQARSKMTCML